MKIPTTVASLTLAVLGASALSACGGGGDDDNVVGAYQIGGTLSGLGAGKNLVLLNNNSDELALSANGGFQFATRLASGAAYSVAVKTQPAGQNCSVNNGSGHAMADIGNVAVTCVVSGGGSGGSTGPTQGVAGVVGEWVQGTCVAFNGTGARQYIRVTKTGDNGVQFDHGLVQYAAVNCTGASSLVGTPTPSGSVSFSRSSATSTAAANWGLWTYPSGQAYTVWVKKGEDTLCLIGDSNPSVLPTPAAAESYADLSITAGACYTRH